MSMSSATGPERRIQSCDKTHTVEFMPDCKYLVSGGREVQVWRLEDGQQVATLLKANDVVSLTVSNDGRWIAAGTRQSGVHVWSAETYELFQFGDSLDSPGPDGDTQSFRLINTIDFSPSSTQLVTASEDTATVWDVASQKRIRTLKHGYFSATPVVAAKYSPLGDRIATVTLQNLRIWDSEKAKSLVGVPVQCDRGDPQRGLAWVNSHLFIVSSDMVIKLNATTGSTISKWTIPSSSSCYSAISLPRHEMFFTYSTEDTLTIWEASIPTALGVIYHHENVHSISLSPDGQFIAIVGESGTIVIQHLASVLEMALLGDSSTPVSLMKEWVKSMLSRSSWRDILAALVNASTLVALRFVLYRAICDYLEISNDITDAVKCFHQMNSELAAQMNTNEERARWVVDFRLRCLEISQSLGDAAMSAQRPEDAIAHYSAALSLNPALPQRILVERSQAYIMKGLWEDALGDTNQAVKLDPLLPWNHESVLSEWAKSKLTAQDGSWKNTLSSSSNFKVSRLTVLKILLERLEAVRRIRDETECLHEMMHELEQEIETKEAKQILIDFLDPRNRLRFMLSPRFLFDFKSRSCKKLEDLANTAMTAKQYDQAISLYSDALGLDPPSPQALFLKRSKAHAARGKWEDAISDANEATTLDPMSLASQEQKFVALRGSGRYQDALYAFEPLLVRLSESPDTDTRERYLQYKNMRTVIRKAIQDAIRDLPRVLIDIASGRLCTRSEQASAFEVSPTCMQLVSSMTPLIDHCHINQEVGRYFRYAMFSHKWEDYEPLFEKVVRVPVYDLEVFPTHEKLQKFCKVARDAGFYWAWSDTCCIDKADHFVLQEALVSMFNWYRGSSLTVVFLRGVSPPSGSEPEHGNLVNSIWNSRMWTFQEYHASKNVRFYNEDWSLYRNLDVPNHKQSPEIILEMEEATGISADALTALQPGLDNIREKLFLASQRETTVPEDAAYALFGIFRVSLPVVYGERDHALGRLLVQLLASSGDTSILAWTGRSGSFNSCFPGELTVFGELPTTHIPHAINSAERETMTTGLRASPPNMPQLMKLYDELLKLPAPLFSGKRMRLPCIAFRLGRVSPTLRVAASKRVFHVKTAIFGYIKIRTTENLSRLDSLILVHPWIDFLLDRRLVEDTGDADHSTSLDSESSSIVFDPTDAAHPAFPSNSSDGSLLSAPPDTTPFVSATSLTSMDSDVETEAMQLLARLRQPFGALLLAPTRRNMAEYKRVAADCIIKVQIHEDASLDELVANIRDSYADNGHSDIFTRTSVHFISE